MRQPTELFSGIGAEIGVYCGENAKDILDNCDIEKLYLIDSYEEYDENQIPMIGGGAEKIARTVLNDYKNIEFVKKKSTDVNLENLDFVYIDADHRYEKVIEDLEHWTEIVKKGGIVSGHDFYWIDDVRRAVCDWAYKKNKKVNFKENDWWFIN